MKFTTVVAASICAVAFTASAAEEEKELQEEESEIFEAGFDFDYFTAYVWRNAVQNDDMVMQPCVWADLTAFDPFYLGFSIWQNYDLTDRRTECLSRGLTENDYNVHLGASVWSTEDEDYDLSLELGHEWYENIGVRPSSGDDYADTREIYIKATFANPVVDVYGQASWMYEDFGSARSGMHYEIGFTKEVEVVESVTVGADWNVNFGDGRYLKYLYGGTSSGKYFEENDDGDLEGPYDDYEDNPLGFGGTTVKVYGTWSVTEFLSVGATIAYTGVINQPLRDAIGDQGDEAGWDGDSYPRDLLWGGVSLKLEF